MLLPGMKKIAILIAVFLAASQPTPVLAWGKTGHRITGAIADHYIDQRTRSAVEAILGNEALAEASNWPDFMRADTSPFWQRTASPWHFVTVPAGYSYVNVGAPPEGDAVTALAHFASIVRDKTAPLSYRQLALRFIIHLVGDLHQPLHAGNGTDRGGNEVAVTFFGQPTNLHAVWDSGMIDQEQLSFTEMSNWLNARITPELLKRWNSPDPQVWIAESAALRDQIYPTSPTITYPYVFEHKAQLDLRLEQGGVRLAAYLNWLFAAQ